MQRTGWRVAVAAVAAFAVSWSVNVAPASQAGEPTADRTGLARFYRQPIDWHGCQQGPQDEDGQALDQAGAQCAEVTVPLDYTRPGRRTTKVAISRLKATDTAGRIGPMIINLGGPAIPVLARVVDARLAMGATGARFDLIGMDQRFTGRSTPVDCGWPSSWIPRSAGATRRSFDRMVTLASELARRCARLPGLGLRRRDGQRLPGHRQPARPGPRLRQTGRPVTPAGRPARQGADDRLQPGSGVGSRVAVNLSYSEPALWRWM